MTVYVSRFAAIGELAPRTAAVRSDAVYLPLLTHVWRLVFEQQAQKRDR